MRTANTIFYVFFITMICVSNTWAQLPLNSRVNIDQNGEAFYYTGAEETLLFTGAVEKKNSALAEDAADRFKNTIPQGFGGIDFSSTDAGTETRLNLVRYNLHYSTKGLLPFYLLMSNQSNRVIKDSQTSRALLDTNGGLLNVKIADDLKTFYTPSASDNTSAKSYGRAPCDFRGATWVGFSGGCYLNVQLGIKVLEYLENEKSQYYGSLYTGLTFSFDLPITNGADVQNPKLLKRAGRLIGAIGVNAYYSSTDRVDLLFPEAKSTLNMDRTFASLSAGLRFTLDDQFSILLNYTKPYGNEDLLEDSYSLSISYSE